MLFKEIIFSDAPILKGYKYKDYFQLVPIFNAKSAPISVYTQHFPCFLEYDIDIPDDCKEDTNIDYLHLSGIQDNKTASFIRQRHTAVSEILDLLSILTNFHFFKYDSNNCLWGIKIPNKPINSLSLEDLEQLDIQTSAWSIGVYTYPSLKNDLTISDFTKCESYYDELTDGNIYYKNNPGALFASDFSIPKHLSFCLDQYYNLKEYKTKTHHCIHLFTDGLSVFNTKKSLSLIAIVSSIEGMSKLEYELLKQPPTIKSKKRLLFYLKNFVSNLSDEKYEKFYNIRCAVVHESKLLDEDIDIFENLEKQNQNWNTRIELMQMARITMYNWLRCKH